MPLRALMWWLIRYWRQSIFQLYLLPQKCPIHYRPNREKGEKHPSNRGSYSFWDGRVFVVKQLVVKITSKYSARKTIKLWRYTLNLQFTLLSGTQWPFYADEHRFNLPFVQLPLASTFSSLASTSWPSRGRSLCRLPSRNNSLRPPLEEQLQCGAAAPRWSSKAKTEFWKQSAPSLLKQSITLFSFCKLD